MITIEKSAAKKTSLTEQKLLICDYHPLATTQEVLLIDDYHLDGYYPNATDKKTEPGTIGQGGASECFLGQIHPQNPLAIQSKVIEIALIGIIYIRYF